jgi:hypothetical protein
VCNNQHASTARHVVTRRSVDLDERRGDVGTEDPPKPGAAMSAEQRQFTQAAARSGYPSNARVLLDGPKRNRTPAGGAVGATRVEVDLWTMVNHFNRPKSGQWQQSMFPRGCIGWRMATTAVASEAAVETSAMETIAIVAAMTRRRVRAGVVIVIVTAPRLLGVSP